MRTIIVKITSSGKYLITILLLSLIFNCSTSLELSAENSPTPSSSVNLFFKITSEFIPTSAELNIIELNTRLPVVVAPLTNPSNTSSDTEALKNYQLLVGLQLPAEQNNKILEKINQGKCKLILFSNKRNREIIDGILLQNSLIRENNPPVDPSTKLINLKTQLEQLTTTLQKKEEELNILQKDAAVIAGVNRIVDLKNELVIDESTLKNEESKINTLKETLSNKSLNDRPEIYQQRLNKLTSELYALAKIVAHLKRENEEQESLAKDQSTGEFSNEDQSNYHLPNPPPPATNLDHEENPGF